jgi:hypothetical protein
MVLVLNIFWLQTSAFDSEPTSGLLILACKLMCRRSTGREMDSWRDIGSVRFAGPAYSSVVLSSKPEFPVHGVGLTLCQSAPVCLIRCQTSTIVCFRFGIGLSAILIIGCWWRKCQSWRKIVIPNHVPIFHVEWMRNFQH